MRRLSLLLLLLVPLAIFTASLMSSGSDKTKVTDQK
jgi:hypothetical protein